MWIQMYPLELKYRAIIHYTEFLRSLRKVAKRYGISKSTLSRWVKGRKKCCPPKKTRQQLHDTIKSIVKSCVVANPTTNAPEIRLAIKERLGKEVSLSSVYRSLHKNGLTYKVAQRTREGQDLDITHPYFASAIDYNNAISIDESSFYWNDSPKKGWGPKGARVHKSRPGRKHRISLLMAVSCSGIVSYRLVSGGVNGDVFSDFLRSIPDRKEIILDNASIHKTQIVKDVCKEKGLRCRFIPPYSPWLNPIEFVFSATKAKYRCLRRQQLPDFLADIVRAIELVDRFEGYFAHCERLLDMDRIRIKNAYQPYEVP